jgi:hypothetical protein
MRLLLDRLSRLRWLGVPLAAYVVVTLILPAATGAAVEHAFFHHAAWVLAGCVAAVAVGVAGGLVAELVALPFRWANHRRARRVAGDA